MTAAENDGVSVPSPLLAGLFPDGAVGAVLCCPGDPSLLLPEERAHIDGAVLKRQREFAAGRQCARAALARFAIVDAPLLANDDRSPRWPAGMIGSVTHTEDFCGAVVARRSRIMALGVDAEIVGRVTPDLWTEICTPAELAWLDGLAAAQQAPAAALIFSAKEATYKCLYPLSGEWIDFGDLTIKPQGGDLSEGWFTIHPLRRLRLPAALTDRLTGRFVFKGRIVVTGAAIAGP